MRSSFMINKRWLLHANKFSRQQFQIGVIHCNQLSLVTTSDILIAICYYARFFPGGFRFETRTEQQMFISDTGTSRSFGARVWRQIKFSGYVFVSHFGIFCHNYGDFDLLLVSRFKIDVRVSAFSLCALLLTFFSYNLRGRFERKYFWNKQLICGKSKSSMDLKLPLKDNTIKSVIIHLSKNFNFGQIWSHVQ